MRKEQLFTGFFIRFAAGAESAHLYIARGNAAVFQKCAIDPGKIGMTLSAHRAGGKNRHIAVNVAHCIFRAKQPRKRRLYLLADLIVTPADTRSDRR